MSYIATFASSGRNSPHRPEHLYPYYTHGPNGETFYVWPAFPHSPEVSTASSECSSSSYNGTPPSIHDDSKAIRTSITHAHPPPRNVKRRVTANRKERRRTLSINHAFSELRDCIPHVPADTKLSKIKCLRLATSYITYLMDVLAQDESKKCSHSEQQIAPPPQHFGFKTEITTENEDRRRPDLVNLANNCAAAPGQDRKARGRTGWPQHVWALELNYENPT